MKVTIILCKPNHIHVNRLVYPSHQLRRELHELITKLKIFELIIVS